MSLTNEEMKNLAITMTDRYFEFLPEEIRCKIMSDKESYEKKRSLIYEVALE